MNIRMFSLIAFVGAVVMLLIGMGVAATTCTGGCNGQVITCTCKGKSCGINCTSLVPTCSCPCG
jgi:hypothetical protein